MIASVIMSLPPFSGVGGLMISPGCLTVLIAALAAIGVGDECAGSSPSTSTASASLPSATPGACPSEPSPSGRLSVPVIITSPVAVSGAIDRATVRRLREDQRVRGRRRAVRGPRDEVVERGGRQVGVAASPASSAAPNAGFTTARSAPARGSTRARPRRRLALLDRRRPSRRRSSSSATTSGSSTASACSSARGSGSSRRLGLVDRRARDAELLERRERSG